MDTAIHFLFLFHLFLVSTLIDPPLQFQPFPFFLLLSSCRLGGKIPARRFARSAPSSAYKKDKVSRYSNTERRVPELIPVLGSQPAGDVIHKPGPAVGHHYFSPGLQLPSQPLRRLLPISLFGKQRHDGCEQFAVSRQRRGCDLNPDPSAPESSTLTTRLPILPSENENRSEKGGEDQIRSVPTFSTVGEDASRGSHYGRRAVAPML